MNDQTNKVAAAIAAVLRADQVTQRAERTLVSKGAESLSIIRDAALAFGPCTSAQFDAVLRKPLREAMKDTKRYTDKVAKVILSYHAKAFIGASNKIAALKDENEQAYVKRITPELVSRKLYVAANKGGTGAKRKGKAKSGKVVKITREGAFAFICPDAADRQALDYVVKNHMDKIRAIYAASVKANDVA